jgi:hypothetical protein
MCQRGHQKKLIYEPLDCWACGSLCAQALPGALFDGAARIAQASSRHSTKAFCIGWQWVLFSLADYLPPAAGSAWHTRLVPVRFGTWLVRCGS